MDENFGSRLKHAWNMLTNKDPIDYTRNIGRGYSTRPDRPRLTRGNERSIITSVYTRLAIDASSMNINHVRTDDDNRFTGIIKSGLNSCLTVEANRDQTGRDFIQDAVISMMDEGCIALVPVDTTTNPNISDAWDLISIRTAKILEWYPSSIKVRIYNDQSGLMEDVMVLKSTVGIINNPFYSVMNEPNSTLQRLIRKLNMLDAVDEASSSGKLDLIIQLPYVIKTEARRQQAEKRRTDIEEQLSGSKYGIAYADGTEHITQLNRPVENNLMTQIEYLTSMLYSQLGITTSILDGTADEKTMLNYYHRTIEPIVSVIVDEIKRKFLSKTARSQNQSVMFFRDPFKLIALKDFAELADKLTRSEVASSNELRQGIGMKPSPDPKADELRNTNMPMTDDSQESSSSSAPKAPITTK